MYHCVDYSRGWKVKSRLPILPVEGMDESEQLGMLLRSKGFKSPPQFVRTPCVKYMTVGGSRAEQCRESTFLRNNAAVTANLGAGACHPPNCRHSCQSHINFRTLGHIHDSVRVYDGHTEGAPGVVNCGEASVPFRSLSRESIQSACNCGWHGRGPCEESEVQVVEGNRCYHRGASVADIQAGRGHSLSVDDCGRCCLSRPSAYLGRDEGGCSFDTRMRGSGGSPCFSVSEDCTHTVTANGYISKPSSMSRKATTISSRSDSTSLASVLGPTQASKQQVIMYGWFLKIPTTGNCIPASSLPQVFIGGYKSSRLLESEYCESGPVVQRLERWRLLTKDGVKVGIRGGIDVEMSAKNGFPSELAMCFRVGFPSSWIFMISNFFTVAPKSCKPDLRSSSASQSNGHGHTQNTKEYGREVPPTTSSLDANPVTMFLSSSLFASPEGTRALSNNNVSLDTGIVSHATPLPQSVNSEKDMDKTRNDCDSCYGAINSGNYSTQNEAKPLLSSESPVTERVLPEGGGRLPASLVHGLPDNGKSAVPKEELSREGVFAVFNNPETCLNEQAHPKLDWGKYLGDGSSRAQEDEARIRACDKVNTVQDVGVVIETVSKDGTCPSVILKVTCASYSRDVGVDGARFSSGDCQERESKVDVHIQDGENEELLTSGDETSKQSALTPEDRPSDISRKRPFQEPSPEESKADRQMKVVCGPSNEVTARSTTGEGASGFLPDTVTVVGPDSRLTQNVLPSTPLQECKKRPRSDRETPCVDDEVRDEVVCDCSEDEPVLDTGAAEQVENILVDVTATAEVLTPDEPKDRKRRKTSSCPAYLSGRLDCSVESLNVGEEPIIGTGEDACEDKETFETEELIVAEDIAAHLAVFPEPNILVQEYCESEAAAKIDAGVDLQKEQCLIPSENLNLSQSASRTRRRVVAILSPLSQKGKELDAALGLATIEVACSNGINRELDAVSNSRELEDTEADHCKEEDKDVATARRSRRRAVAIISPSSQRGKDLDAAPGIATIEVACSNGIGKEFDAVSNLGRELEDIEADHCKEEAKDVVATTRRRRKRVVAIISPSSQRGKDLDAAPDIATTEVACSNGIGKEFGAVSNVGKEFEDPEADHCKDEAKDVAATARRSSRRAVAIMSPSSQRGKELDPAPGLATIEVACSDGIGKEFDAVSNLGRELEGIEADHCKEGAKDVVAITRRRRRRAVAIISPSSPRGKDLDAAPVLATIEIACSDGIGKEFGAVSNLGRELEDIEAEHCKGDAKDVAATARRKYRRSSRIKYYKRRRRKHTEESLSESLLDKFSEVSFDPDSNHVSQCPGGGKFSEVGMDDCPENSRNRNSATPRKKQHRATKNFYRTMRKAHGRDSHSLGDGAGDAACSQSPRDPEVCENVNKSSKRWRKTADRCSSPARKLLSSRCSPRKASRKVEESKYQTRSSKSRSSIVPPPPPAPRVVDKSMVPEAFGLKKSRHGRVLVPRLASWLNQSIKYDLDGSIIAIDEGFEAADDEFGSGHAIFKLPSDKDAVSMQRKLRLAAEATGFTKVNPRSL